MIDSSNHNPLVSVFMITYNHEKYIAKALESILIQKVNFQYEIVVGEDCSTDKTREILLNYYNKFPDKFNLILHEKNIGATNNQYITLKKCTGKYIACLEGDDYWTDPFKLQKQVDFLEKNPDYSICYHPAEYRYEDLAPRRIFDVNHIENETTYTEDLIKNDYIPFCTCMLRRDNIKEIPIWFKEAFPGDWPLLLLASFGKKIFRLKDRMSTYRVHNKSIYASNESSFLKTCCLNMFNYIEKDAPEIYLQQIKDKKFDLSIEIYKLCLNEGKITAALKFIPVIYSKKNNQNMRQYFEATKIIVVSFIRKFIKKRTRK